MESCITVARTYTSTTEFFMGWQQNILCIIWKQNEFFRTWERPFVRVISDSGAFLCRIRVPKEANPGGRSLISGHSRTNILECAEMATINLVEHHLTQPNNLLPIVWSVIPAKRLKGYVHIRGLWTQCFSIMILKEKLP